ncbi:hypothetical protein H6P81_007285 [Aristolochia fimbriata]|uniref:Uncharacterized protein n=1 Tax=Aristolochia fimbriata TaxID=158543 RepID=A0AAV7F3G1_ARIFI|nr:hypothetical protein H6P81_007285 [Aristolochia fimbriata]
MDFHSLGRRDLQALCKKNRIPANMTNVAMADALMALEIVEGIEDIQPPVENENSQVPVKTPAKALAQTPDVSRSCRRSTRRKPVPPTEVESENVQESSQPITRTRRGTATKVSAVASRRRILKEEVNQEEDPKESQTDHESQEVSQVTEIDTESRTLETPVSRNVGRRRVAATSVRRKAETKTKRADTPVVVDLSARTGTRRSTRLVGSEKKLFEELPSTRKCGGKKEVVEISDALFEVPEIIEETPEESSNKSYDAVKISDESGIIEETPEETLDKSEAIDSIGIPSDSHSIEQPFEKDEDTENDQQVSSAEVTDDTGVFPGEIISEAQGADSETHIMPENGLNKAEECISEITENIKDAVSESSMSSEIGLDEVQGSISDTFENVQVAVSESYTPPETEEKHVAEPSNWNLETEVNLDDDVLSSEVPDDVPSMECETFGVENENPIADQPEELASDSSPAFKPEESVLPVCEENNDLDQEQVNEESNDLDQQQDNDVISVEAPNENESYQGTSKLVLPSGEPDDALSLVISEDGLESADKTSEIDEWIDDASSSISSLADVDIAEYEAEAGLEDSVLDNSEPSLFSGEVTVDIFNKGDHEGTTEHQPLPEETSNIVLENRDDSVYSHFATDLAEALTPLRVVPSSSTACSRILVISPPRKAITPNSGSHLRRISSAKKGTTPIKSNGKKKAPEPDNKENTGEQSITRETKVGKVKLSNKKVLEDKSLRQLKRMLKDKKETANPEVGRKSAALQPLTENCLSARKITEEGHF